jgi:hypothetical protein
MSNMHSYQIISLQDFIIKLNCFNTHVFFGIMQNLELFLTHHGNVNDTYKFNQQCH